MKSSAYLQSWGQQRPSTIRFSHRKTLGWDATTGLYEAEPRHHADVYVFAPLAQTDQATVDPLDIDQWSFYIVSTRRLEARTRSQHSITLSSLEKITTAVGWPDLREAVRTATRDDLELKDTPASAEAQE